MMKKNHSTLKYSMFVLFSIVLLLLGCTGPPTGKENARNLRDQNTIPEYRGRWIEGTGNHEKLQLIDLAFETMRLYIRRTDSGYLVILLSNSASMAMVRLNCDILLPALKQDTGAKGFGRFFKLKK